MKKALFILLCLVWALDALAWGQKGHDVTAYIAENHLTRKAARAVDRVLRGHSPVYYSNSGDRPPCASLSRSAVTAVSTSPSAHLGMVSIVWPSSTFR